MSAHPQTCTCDDPPSDSKYADPTAHENTCRYRALAAAPAPELPAHAPGCTYGEMFEAGGEAKLAAHPLDCDCKSEQDQEDEWVIGTLRMFLNMCDGDLTGRAVEEAWEHDFDSMSYCLNGARAFVDRRLPELLAEVKQLKALAAEVERLKSRQQAHVNIINRIAESLGLPEGSSDEDADDAIQSLTRQRDALAETGHHLGLLALQSDRYRTDGEYRQATDDMLAALRAAGRLP